MDKNILAEYQKRVEEIPNKLEQSRAELQERIAREQSELNTRMETEQSRLAQQIESNQARLDVIQGPVNMDDVTYTENSLDGSRVAGTVREEYSQDEEGNLLRQFDIAVNDRAVTRQEIEEIVKFLRAHREKVRDAEIEGLRAEIADLQGHQEQLEQERQEEQSRIEVDEQESNAKIENEAQEEGKQLISELQVAQNEIAQSIKGKLEQLDISIKKSAESAQEALEYKEILARYSNKESKGYIGTKADLKRCRERARKANQKIDKLDVEITDLRQDLGTVEALLETLYNMEINKAFRQEEEMWEAYRAETKEAEERRDREVEEGLAAKRLEEEREEARIEEETKREIEQYADELNPEEQQDAPKPQESAQSEQQVEPKPQKSVQPEQQAKSSPAQGGQQTEPTKPQGKSQKWKVETVAFTIEGKSNPVYKIVASNGKEKREFTSTEISILDAEFDHDEIKQLEGKGIHEAEKYYDKGLVQLLEQIDGELGTSSLKEYQELLKDREMLHRYPERYEDCMKIDYDFSELRGKASKEMKQLQKIAKECGIKGVAIYQKRPNIFKRIWRSLTKNVRLLKETPLEPNMSEKDLNTMSILEKMERGSEDRPYEQDIDALKDYAEFSPEVAQEQLLERAETVEEMIKVEDTIDAAKAWRKAQQIETPTVDPDDLPNGQPEKSENER